MVWNLGNTTSFRKTLNSAIPTFRVLTIFCAADCAGEDEAAEDESKDDVADQQRYVRLALANRRAAEAAVDDDYDAGTSNFQTWPSNT